MRYLFGAGQLTEYADLIFIFNIDTEHFLTEWWGQKRKFKIGSAFEFGESKEGLGHLRSCLLTLQSAPQNGEQMIGPQSQEPRTPTLFLSKALACISPAFIIQGVLCFHLLIENRHTQTLINGFPGIVALVAE